MPTIHLTTFIAAPANVVFDLSRSVDIHKKSMHKYHEEVVNGTSVGLMEQDDTVTWKAKHLFKTRLLRVKITGMKKNEEFTDEQLDGDFKYMKHEHYFKSIDNGTIMIDLFHFELPYGAIGKCLNSIYITRYIKKLLQQRNDFIKQFAESGQWKQLLVI